MNPYAANITLNAKDSTRTPSSIRVRVDAELMRQYLPARAVNPKNAIAVMKDSTGAPLIFSIGEDGLGTPVFYVIVYEPGSQTGWTPYALSSHLPLGYVPDLFAATQDANGDIHLALSMRHAQQDAATVFITGPIKNDPANFKTDPKIKTPWPSWLKRDLDGLQQVVQFTMGTNDDGLGAPLTLAAIRRVGNVGEDTWLVNMDPSATGSAWTPYPLPEDARELLSLAVGTVAGARGLFALYNLGNGQTLEFTSLPDAQGQRTYYDFPLPGDNKLAAIAVVPGKPAAPPSANPCCKHCSSYSDDLYAAGQGAYLYPNSTTSAPTTIATKAALPDVHPQGLVVSGDYRGAAIWAISDDEKLYFFAGPGSAGSGTWDAPSLLKQNAGQVAALWHWETIPGGDAIERCTHEVFVVSGDARLSHLWQDSGSTLWHEHAVPVPDTGKAYSFESYTSHIRVTTTTGVILSNAKVTVSASQWVYIYVNGQAHSIDPGDPAILQTDSMGNLTIIYPTGSIATPIFHLEIDGYSGIIDINPAARVTNGLKQSSVNDFKTQAKAQTPSWAGSVPASTATDTDLEAGHTALGKSLSMGGHATNPSLGGSCASVRPDGVTNPQQFGKVTPDALGGKNAWGVNWAADGTITVQTADNPGQLIAGFATAIKATIGNLFQAAKEAGKEVGSFILHTLEDVPGLGLVVKIGEEVFKLVLKGLSELWHAIGWVLNKLGFLLAKLLIWLGIIPDPTELVKTQRVLANTARQIIGLVGDELLDIKAKMDAAFSSVESYIAAWGDVTVPPEFADSGKNVAMAPDKVTGGQPGSDVFSSPGGFFPIYQLLNGGVFSFSPASLLASILGGDEGGENSLPAAVEQAVTNLVAEVGDDIVKDIQAVIGQIYDLVSRTLSGKLDFEGLLKAIAADVAIDLLQLVKQLLDLFFDLLVAVLKIGLAALNTKLKIPFVKGFYEAIVDSAGAKDDDFTFLNGAAMLLAFAVNVAYKALTGKASPFADGTFGLDTAEGMSFAKILAPEFKGFAVDQTITTNPQPAPVLEAAPVMLAAPMQAFRAAPMRIEAAAAPTYTPTIADEPAVAMSADEPQVPRYAVEAVAMPEDPPADVAESAVSSSEADSLVAEAAPNPTTPTLDHKSVRWEPTQALKIMGWTGGIVSGVTQLVACIGQVKDILEGSANEGGGGAGGGGGGGAGGDVEMTPYTALPSNGSTPTGTPNAPDEPSKLAKGYDWLQFLLDAATWALSCPVDAMMNIHLDGNGGMKTTGDGLRIAAWSLNFVAVGGGLAGLLKDLPKPAEIAIDVIGDIVPTTLYIIGAGIEGTTTIRKAGENKGEYTEEKQLSGADLGMELAQNATALIGSIVTVAGKLGALTHPVAKAVGIGAVIVVGVGGGVMQIVRTGIDINAGHAEEVR